MVWKIEKMQENAKEAVVKTRDPMCKKAFNGISKTSRRISRKRALERWE
jgi:hypothetical protein